MLTSANWCWLVPVSRVRSVLVCGLAAARGMQISGAVSRMFYVPTLLSSHQMPSLSSLWLQSPIMVTTANGCSVITWRQIKCQFKSTSIARCAAMCLQPVVARLGAGRVCDVFGIKLGFCWLVVCSLNVRQSRYFDKVGRTGQCGQGHVGTEQGMGGMEGILALRRLIDQTYCFITIAMAMAVLCKNVWRLRWSVWK